MADDFATPGPTTRSSAANEDKWALDEDAFSVAGESQRMLTTGSEGEDNPEELVKEEADAAAEGRAVLSVEVGLIQCDQAKDLPPVATQYGGTEDAVHGELL